MTRKRRQTRLNKFYQSVSIILTNTGLLFLVLNLFLFFPSVMRDAEVKTRQDQAQAERIRARAGQPLFTQKRNGHQMLWTDLRSYEGVDPAHVNQVLDDFFDMGQKGYAYHPYTHFTEPTFSSPTLNLQADDQGFISRRVAHKQESKYPLRVFAFGGSTTFGWHVGDEETIPSYLERELQQKLRRQGNWRRVEVTNFGKGFNSWYQEMVLFERLLHAGYKPDVVVFLDGVNVLHADSPYEIPYWNDKMTELWDQAQISTTSLPGMLPLFRVLNYFKRRHLNKWVRNFQVDRHPSSHTYALPDWVKRVQESYLNTLKQIDAISSTKKIQAFYFWQPNRAFDCQSGKYSQPLPSHYTHKIVPLYTAMRNVERPRFRFLGDLCRTFGFDKRVIVDDVHYSPAFNEFIASEMARHINIAKR
ncbi:MAG: SGNH/GDSL hydrolase family protein [Bdellovibrionales bacterium]|nr:SGNH/GDSL hydrolase family protein [Bdellovibrionales bacterium]